MRCKSSSFPHCCELLGEFSVSPGWGTVNHNADVDETLFGSASRQCQLWVGEKRDPRPQSHCLPRKLNIFRTFKNTFNILSLSTIKGGCCLFFWFPEYLGFQISWRPLTLEDQNLEHWGSRQDSSQGGWERSDDCRKRHRPLAQVTKLFFFPFFAGQLPAMKGWNHLEPRKIVGDIQTSLRFGWVLSRS